MKTKMIALLLCVSFMATAQVKIIQEYDDMADKVYTFANSRIIIANEAKTIGFSVDVYFDDKCHMIEHLVVIMTNIGGCNEKDKLTILFEDGQRMVLNNWNDFNCKGTCYFALNPTNHRILTTVPLYKIQIQNGRSFDTFTGEVPNKKKNYFIDIAKLLSKQEFIKR